MACKSFFRTRLDWIIVRKIKIKDVGTYFGYKSRFEYIDNSLTCGIMHNRPSIIRHIEMGCIVKNPITWIIPNVSPVQFYVFISIRSLLFVIKPKCMDEFMYDSTMNFPIFPDTNWFQTEFLFTTMFSYSWAASICGIPQNHMIKLICLFSVGKWKLKTRLESFSSM